MNAKTTEHFLLGTAEAVREQNPDSLGMAFIVSRATS